MEFVLNSSTKFESNQFDHSISNFHNQSQTILVFLDQAAIQISLMFSKLISHHIFLRRRILDYSIDKFDNNPIHPYLSKRLLFLSQLYILRYSEYQDHIIHYIA